MGSCRAADSVLTLTPFVWSATAENEVKMERGGGVGSIMQEPCRHNPIMIRPAAVQTLRSAAVLLVF